jgi:endonuclease/exonuclease/phosphatase family metal-dependent hydrolase
VSAVPEATLRVMTYNVRSLRDDVEVIASLVRDVAPDVLLVQEAPRFLRWRSKRAALARRCGLVVATTDRLGGLCIMTSLGVDVGSTSFSILPKHPKQHQRAVVAAVVEHAGASWRVASTHLSTDDQERIRHLGALTAVLADQRQPAPLVLGGDINEGPTGPVFSALAARWQDCFAVAGTGTGLTSTAAVPIRRLDAIFADPALSVVSCEAVDAPGVEWASDHRPVVAELRQSRV